MVTQIKITKENQFIKHWELKPLTGFGTEIKYLRDNGIRDAYLKDGTLINLDNINLNNIDWSEWKY